MALAIVFSTHITLSVSFLSRAPLLIYQCLFVDGGPSENLQAVSEKPGFDSQLMDSGWHIVASWYVHIA